jgi:hypothetical protein
MPKKRKKDDKAKKRKYLPDCGWAGRLVFHGGEVGNGW